MEITSTTLLFALLGGIVPAVLWLMFWLYEDRKSPEPRGLIMLAFFAGMISVGFAMLLELGAKVFFAGTTLVILWAVIEESCKFAVAYLFVLRNRAVNEPVDVIIYMITVALGFAAIENTLFLLDPISNGFIADSILTGNLRFIGSTLLHVLASATVGVALAFTFYKSKMAHEFALFTGLILASILHALFNFFILKNNGDVELMKTFFAVWLGVIVLILVFERIKRIGRPRNLFIRRKK